MRKKKLMFTPQHVHVLDGVFVADSHDFVVKDYTLAHSKTCNAGAFHDTEIDCINTIRSAL